MRAGIYARVSSGKQRDKHTIASQLAEIPKMIAANEWTLVRSYVDDGKTAKAGHLDKRTGLADLVTDMRAGLLDVVVMVDIDRLTRSEDIEEQGKIFGAFQQAGVKIAELHGGIITLDNFADIIRLQMKAQVAADENRKRSERSKRGRLHAARNSRPSGPLPLGFSFSRGAWSHTDAAPIVVEIYRRFIAGESTHGIARWLQVSGVKRARSRRWSRERVYKILNAPCNRGEWIADRTSNIVIGVPPIVDDATWYAAQSALMRSRTKGLRRTRHVYLCEGVSVCALCSTPMGIKSTEKGGKRYVYYVCRSRRDAWLDAPCSLPFRSVDDVDERVWRAVSDLLASPENVERAIGRQRERDGDASKWKGDLDEFTSRLTRLEQNEAVIVERFQRGQLSRLAFDAAADRSTKERKLLERQIEIARSQSAPAERVSLASMQAMLEEVRDQLPTAPLELRREFVRALVSGRDGNRIVIGENEIEIQALVPQALSRLSLARLPACRKDRESNTSQAVSIRLVAHGSP